MSKKTFIKIVALLVTLAGLFGFLLPAMLSSKNDFTPILAKAEADANDMLARSVSPTEVTARWQ